MSINKEKDFRLGYKSEIVDPTARQSLSSYHLKPDPECAGMNSTCTYRHSNGFMETLPVISLEAKMCHRDFCTTQGPRTAHVLPLGEV